MCNLTFILCPGSLEMWTVETGLLRNKTNASVDVLEDDAPFSKHSKAVLSWALSRFRAGFPHPGPQGEREEEKVETSLARYPISLLSSSPFL